MLQVKPESRDMSTSPRPGVPELIALNIREPSAEHEAKPLAGPVAPIQVVPKSGEMRGPAMSQVPSAERARTGIGKAFDTVDCDQVSPPLVEVARLVRIELLATTLEPVAEQAQDDHMPESVSRDVQVTPESSEVNTWPEAPSVVAISLTPSNDDATLDQERAESRAVQIPPELVEV